MITSVVRYDVRRALAAARTLAQNPDDLAQVFTIIESLSGTSLVRTTLRFAMGGVGRRLMREQPDIVELLADREALAQLPDGSLGRAYLDFVGRENISADGIRAANEQGGRSDVSYPPPLDFVHKRLRDTHDLWHAVIGYQGDVLGETALLAFYFAQIANPAVALIVAFGLLKTDGPETRRVIFDGFRRGRKAAWLAAQDWESMLALPLSEVRARLSLEAPPEYTPIRSAELRAA